MRPRRTQTVGLGRGIDAFELDPIDLFAGEIRRLAGILDLHLLQHLAAELLDMLVVDAHALETIDLLNLADEIVGERLDPEDAQNIVRDRIAIHQEIALLDVIAFLHADMLALGDQILDRIGTLLRRHHHDAALGLVVLAELDAALALADDGEVLGLACLEQFRDARQTAGDVTGLRALTRDTRQHVAGPHLGAVLDRENGIDRHEVPRLGPVRELQHVALGIAQGDQRPQIVAARLLFPIDHNLGRDAGGFVDHLAHRNAFGEIDIMRDTVALGDDRNGVGVPFRQLGALGDHLAVIGQQLGAIRHLVLGLFAAGLVEQHEFAIAAHHHRNFGGVDDDVAVDDLHLGIERRLDRALLGAALNRAADMERAHGELGAGLADRLRRDDADRLAHIDGGAARQIAAIAFAAQTLTRLAGQDRADQYLVDTELLDDIDIFLIDQLAGLDQHLLAQGIEDIDRRAAAEHAIGQRRDDIAAFDHGPHGKTAGGTAILLGDDGVLCHIDQAAGQVTRIRGLERGVGQSLAGTVGRVEILEHGEAFLEVRNDRRLDDLARRLGHQTAHAGKLFDLRRRAAGAGIGHHPNGVDRLAGLGRLDRLHHFIGDLFRAVRPHVDHLVVFLALGDQAVEILLLVFLDLVGGRGDQLFLRRRDDQIVLAERDAGLARLIEAEGHQPDAENDRLLLTAMAIDLIEEVGDLLLGQQAVHQIEPDLNRLRQDFRQQHAAGRGDDPLDHGLALGIDAAHARGDAGMQGHRAGFQRLLDLAERGEGHALALFAVALHRDVIEAKHDILRRHDDRLAIGRRQDVVGRHHQDARFELGFQRQRHMDRHLVAVEIRVAGGADQRMKLNRLALDQGRLERLNTQTMQGRRAVQQHRMLADHFFQNVPDLGALFLHRSLRRLDGAGEAIEFELGVDEGLEQLQRHFLRQAALMQLQFRADDDHRAAGIIDPLAEQILTEAALLALQHVGQRLQRPLVDAGDDAAAAAIVEQRVHRLLQHALFVAHDDVGRPQFHQPLQTIVAVDDAAIEIVQIGGRKAAAIQRHQRPQLRRNHRHHVENHPFRPAVRFHKGFDQLQPLHQLLTLGVGIGIAQLAVEALLLFRQIDRGEQLLHRLGADAGGERFLAELILRLDEVFLVEELVLLQIGQTRLGHDVGFEIENLLEILQRHVEQKPDAARQRLQEPDVRDRRGQLDMAHALAPDLRKGDFDAALLAHDAAILHALVLAAQALIILDRTENARAKQALALGLEGAIVNRLRLLDLAEGPGADALRAGDRDADLVEALRPLILTEDVHQLIHEKTLSRRSIAALLELDIEPQRSQFLDQHVEGFRNTGLEIIVTAHDRLIDLGAARHVVGLHRQHFVQRIGGAIGLERPDFHFAEALAAELRLAAQRLLGDEAVGADRPGVDLIVHQVMQLQHVDVADRDLAIELLAGAAIGQRHLARDVEPGLRQQSHDVLFARAIEHRRRQRHAVAQIAAQLHQFAVVQRLDLGLLFLGGVDGAEHAAVSYTHLRAHETG